MFNQEEFKQRIKNVFDTNVDSETTIIILLLICESAFTQGRIEGVSEATRIATTIIKGGK